MFTTKHFIWIGICILFILIMNHYAKKEDFTLQNACYFFMFICLLSETTKMMSDMIPSVHGGMHLNPYLQYLIVYCGLHYFWKGWSTKTKNDQLLCGCRYLRRNRGNLDSNVWR